MTDLRNRVVEAMARAQCRETGKDPDFVVPGTGGKTRLDAYRDICAPALTALLSELDAAGWQLVPKVLTEYQIETVRENGGNQAVAYLMAAWPDLLAAAPDPFKPEDAA